jgi:surface polysaccharide O-acyltransferase-like enzyme
VRPAAPGPQPQRIHYLDTLKVAVVYGILLYHSALPFTWTSWLLSNPQKSIVLMAFTAFCFPWGIPMMFLLSGADSWFALRSRSAMAFLQARFLRLVLPLAAGIVLLSPLQWYLTTVGAQRSLPGLLQSYPTYLRGIRLSWTPEWIGRYGYHLWFLGYLFAITVVVLPALELLKRPAARRVIAAAAELCQRSWALYAFALPYFVSQVALRTRYPAYQDWADIATYAFVFLAGYVLASERRFEAAIRGGIKLELAAGVISTAGVGLMLLEAGGQPANQELRDVTFSLLWSVMVWSWLLAVLTLGMRWMDFRNRLTAYLAESILPFYVIHHPVVVFVASIVIPLPLGVWPKFLVVAGSALVVTLLVYETLIRRWAPARLVFGLRPRAAPARRPGQSLSDQAARAGELNVPPRDAPGRRRAGRAVSPASSEEMACTTDTSTTTGAST